MSQITILNQEETENGWMFDVSLGRRSRYAVELSEEYYQKLTSETVTPEKLVEESFTFLLERESAGAIMTEFNLSDILTYFPEYEEKISERLQNLSKAE